MFPDTANFTDPNYTDFGAVPDLTSSPDFSGFSGDFSPSAPTGSPAAGGADFSSFFGSGASPSTGGAASNTPAQSSTTGTGLLGWLGLANNVAKTALTSTKMGTTTRPGVTKQQASLGSFGAVTTTTLLIIVAVFFGAVYLLRR